VKVPLPEGARHGDVVKLKLTIDHNKILHWWYSVGQGEFTAASPFNDPWTPRQLDPSEKRLLVFRRQMADELTVQNQLSDDTLLHEATLLRLAGRHDEAELAVRDLVAEHGLTGRAANLLAVANPEGCQIVAGGRSGQRGERPPGTSLETNCTQEGCQNWTFLLRASAIVSLMSELRLAMDTCMRP
jgi:hypothetical protein